MKTISGVTKSTSLSATTAFAGGSLFDITWDKSLSWQVQTPEVVQCTGGAPGEMEDYGDACFKSTAGWWFAYDATDSWEDGKKVKNTLGIYDAQAFVIGAGADDLYCAAYAGIGIAGALELKDKLWGGEPDWIDFSITLAGVAIGYASRVLVLSWLR